jgi:hypothetical protein
MGNIQRNLLIIVMPRGNPDTWRRDKRWKKTYFKEY